MACCGRGEDEGEYVENAPPLATNGSLIAIGGRIQWGRGKRDDGYFGAVDVDAAAGDDDDDDVTVGGDRRNDNGTRLWGRRML